jgi:hypothetical protein
MLGVIISCLDEDYYVDTRRVSCHVMQHLIRIAGPAMKGRYHLRLPDSIAGLSYQEKFRNVCCV